jgi:ABC-2 type transport system ATP-binding protein
VSQDPPASREQGNPKQGNHHQGIEVEGLRKSFGDVRALDGLSFSAAPGSVLAVLGPNGAGKTTTVDVCTTLLKPDAGTVRVAGYDVVSSAAEVRRRIGVTGQFAALDADLTGAENLALFGRLGGLPKKAALTRSAELAEAFGLQGIADRRVNTYSGGQRRRLDLAASLTTRPEVLFLDEPTTGLDPPSRQELWGMVRTLAASGTCVLLTTQYLEEAEALADRVLVVDGGRAVADGTVSELRAHGGAEVVRVALRDPAHVPGAVRALGALGEVMASPDRHELVIRCADTAAVMRAVPGALEGVPGELLSVTVELPTLEEVFQAITGADRPTMGLTVPNLDG